MLLNQLHQILADAAAARRKTVLAIDEAHVIAKREALDELRMLLNFQSDDEFLVTLILLGHPPLLRTDSATGRRTPGTGRHLGGARDPGARADRVAPGATADFIDLDGESPAARRRRSTSVVAYDREQRIAHVSLDIPVSRHPIDSVNLGDPRVGVVEAVDDLLATTGVEKGRVDISLGPGERDAGLTVTEYEPLLMRHDLAEVLRDPLRFAAVQGRHILDDPLAVPTKSLSYAHYDLVRVMNTLMEAFHDSKESHYSLGIPSKEIGNYELVEAFGSMEALNKYLEENYKTGIKEEDFRNERNRDVYGDYVVELGSN